jgi:hypothetical protein
VERLPAGRGGHLLAALACAAAIATGCGSDEEPRPIPADLATRLDERLNTIQAQVAGDATCEQIDQSSFAQVDRDLAEVPQGEVHDALVGSFDRLRTLVQEECEQEPPQTETTPPPTEPTPPPTTETETEQTQTEQTETEQTETEQPQQDGSNDDQGRDGGGDGGGGATAPGGGE